MHITDLTKLSEIALIDIKKSRVTRPYVYVVYSCKNSGYGGNVEGVYINKEEAEGKRGKLMAGNITGRWVAVLKKPLHGKNFI